MLSRMKKIKIFFLILIMNVFILGTFCQAEGAVEEHCFGYNHPAFSYYNAYRNTTYSVSALNTTTNAANIHDALVAHGYYSGSYYVNNQASIVQTCIGRDAIFYINSHGAAGLVCCPYNNSGTWTMTYLSANSTPDNMAWSLQYKYENTTDKLKRVRFAYFGGCNTANTSSIYGNLLNMANSLGVDCSLGFTGNITTNRNFYFSERLIAYYGMDPNNTVSACAASASSDTFNVFGDFGGVNTYSIVGNGGIKLVPAAYGTY